MTPITGPLEKFESNSSPTPGSYVKYRRWYRQKRPYTLPLPFTSRGWKTVSGKNLEDWYGSPGWSYNPSWMYAGFQGGSSTPLDTLASEAASVCRERFNSKIRDVSEMGTGLAEARSSLDMISKRAIQLYRFTRALRRFDFKGAGQQLEVAVYGDLKRPSARYKGRHHSMSLRRDSHAFADNFLEYWFGWSPMISDIGKAIDVIDSPYIGDVNVKARAKLTGSYSNRVNTFYPWAPVYDSGNHSFSALVKTQANVKVVNQNVNLAAQLGLVNPLSVAWELVPFSFVVDYFVNIGDYLANYSSLAGLELSSISTTSFKKDSCSASQTWWDNRLYRECNSEYYEVVRTNSLPEVTLRTKALTLPIGRALSSISLLIQQGIKRV